MTLQPLTAMLMASAWGYPMPGAAVPLRTRLASGWQPGPVWRNRLAEQAAEQARNRRPRP
jgi:hypothetical protein